MTCTAMSGSGARTGTAIIRKKTWLTRKDQKKGKPCAAWRFLDASSDCRSAFRIRPCAKRG